jgi:hypothetical protein
MYDEVIRRFMDEVPVVVDGSENQTPQPLNFELWFKLQCKYAQIGAFFLCLDL